MATTCESSAHIFSRTGIRPGGEPLNFDGEQFGQVRRFLIENVLHWVHECHIDGLRLDAAHTNADDDPRHFIAELAACVHGAAPDNSILVIAADHRNLAHVVKPSGHDAA